MTALGSVRLDELAASLADGTVTPVELVDATAEYYDRTRELNAFLAVDFDLARSHAEKLMVGGRTDRPLWGIPLSLKDLEPTTDLPTTMGSRLHAGPAVQEGLLSRRLRDAGAIVFGKTNTPAFGHKDTTDNLVAPPARNPWDPSRTPGGSSGGAAAIVAAGMCRVAHGTDAAGSVRMPAALCGVVGFKPSYGRVPRVPSDDLWAGRAHHGFLGKSVAEIAYVLDCVVGPDPRDPLSVANEPVRYTQHSRIGSRTVRVGYALSLFGQEVDAGVAAAFESCLRRLDGPGIAIEPVSSVDWQDPYEWVVKLTAAGNFAKHGDTATRRPEDFDSSYRAIIQRGSTVTAREVMEGQLARSRLYRQALELSASYDFILTPTLPLTAWGVDVEYPRINGRAVARPPGGRWSDVLLANVLGWPALSLPAGLSGGLPVGIQILGSWRADASCLEFGRLVEERIEFASTPGAVPR